MDVPERDAVYELLRDEDLDPAWVDGVLASLERGASSGKDDWGGNLLMLEVDRAAGTVAVGNDLDADWEVVMSFESFRTVARTHAAAMTLRQGATRGSAPGTPSRCAPRAG